MLNPDCYLFAGPTLYRKGMPLPIPDRIRVLPPVRRGDVERLAESEPPGALAIVDGLFHQDLAVAHREIREAMRCGWRVWGLSSMGAIRACEMSALGMNGYGEVFGQFVGGRFEDFQDDEVALLHESEPPYRPLTEPMVHLRAALAYLVDGGWLSRQGEERVIEQLKGLWYGERTLDLFGASLRMEELPGDVLTTVLQDFDRFRIKTADLQRFLQSNIWQP